MHSIRSVARGIAVFRWEPKPSGTEVPAVDGYRHKTVKPLELMRWLARLVIPPGGTVLDLFAGSGPTAEAAHLEGMTSVIIEREPQNHPLIDLRLTRHEEATA